MIKASIGPIRRRIKRTKMEQISRKSKATDVGFADVEYEAQNATQYEFFCN